jgi:sigma-70-like protein
VKSASPDPTKVRLPREQDKRVLDMYQAYLRGMTMREVGALYGIGTERVRQLFSWNHLPRRQRNWRPPKRAS